MDSEEEEDDTPNPSTPLCAPQPPSKATRTSLERDQQLPPYISLRGWDDLDIDEVSKQDLVNMWQLAEGDLRLQIQQLAKEKAQLVKQVSSVSSTKQKAVPTDL